ncbi:chemotaxis protein CheA, partial [Xanthomonas citri pv. citri]|nr:chemotaxis protein CheA [Xanthomonas citri pv. citri]
SDWEYDEFERTVIQEAEEQGFKRYEIKISLNENCMLKAVRVYMVFEKLNEVGEVAKTIPSAEVLETEDFGTDFQVCFLTHQSAEDIEQLINGVS